MSSVSSINSSSSSSPVCNSVNIDEDSSTPKSSVSSTSSLRRSSRARTPVASYSDFLLFNVPFCMSKEEMILNLNPNFIHNDEDWKCQKKIKPDLVVETEIEDKRSTPELDNFNENETKFVKKAKTEKFLKKAKIEKEVRVCLVKWIPKLELSSSSVNSDSDTCSISESSLSTSTDNESSFLPELEYESEKNLNKSNSIEEEKTGSSFFPELEFENEHNLNTSHSIEEEKTSNDTFEIFENDDTDRSSPLKKKRKISSFFDQITIVKEKTKNDKDEVVDFRLKEQSPTQNEIPFVKTVLEAEIERLRLVNRDHCKMITKLKNKNSVLQKDLKECQSKVIELEKDLRTKEIEVDLTDHFSDIMNLDIPNFITDYTPELLLGLPDVNDVEEGIDESEVFEINFEDIDEFLITHEFGENVMT